MLANTQTSNLYYGHFTTPSMTHPHPIKKHVDSLSNESQTRLRQFVGQKLLKMDYARSIEEIFELYDCCDPKEEEAVAKKFTYVPDLGYAPAFYSFLVVMAFLKYRKFDVLSLNSYLKNIYSVTYIGILTYTFVRYIDSYSHYVKLHQNFDDISIARTRKQIHADNVSLINTLRFDKAQMF